MNNLVEMYKKGAITADHLALECLQMIDPASPELVLEALPPEVMVRMLRFAAQYGRNGMVTNYGAPPAMDQVAAARTWIEDMHPEVSKA